MNAPKTSMDKSKKVVRKIPAAAARKTISIMEQSMKKNSVYKKKDRKEELNQAQQKKKSKQDDDKDDHRIPNYMKSDQKTPEQKAAFEKIVKGLMEKGVDALLKEYSEQLKPYVTKDYKKEIFDQNHHKNRYKDVICNDLTRVVVNDGKGSDYIHANHVKGDPLFNEFICTQGCMKNSIHDFWRMVLHHKVEHIVMLCEVIEAGKPKCEPYWPTTQGQKMTFEDITVTATTVNTKDAQITKTYLDVEVGGVKTTMRHHHWKTWPDRSVPKSSLAVLRVLQATRGSSTPIVVHCSAGIGRTGTLVAVEMCLQSILGKQSLNLLETCKRLKDQRMGSIQVDVQYVYIAQVMIECGKALGYWNAPDIAEEYAKFKAKFDEILKTRASEEKVSGRTHHRHGAAAPVVPPIAITPVVVTPPAKPDPLPAPSTMAGPDSKFTQISFHPTLSKSPIPPGPPPPAPIMMSKDKDDKTKMGAPPGPPPPPPVVKPNNDGSVWL